MSGRYLLDSNIVVALFAGEPDLLSHLKEAEEVFLPSVVIGELYYGAFKSARAVENVERIHRFVEVSVVLGCDGETARRYGQVKFDLSRKGRPIPENDIWIAALAVQYNLTLVSRGAHFSEIEELTIERWQ